MWGGGAGQGSASSDILDLGTFNFYPQTKYLVDMSYLRMKNITLGYTIPQNITRKFLVDRLRVYVATDNLFDIINHNKGTGIDPEINTGVGSYGNGVWGRTEPIMRTYSCGLQLTFGSSSTTAVAANNRNSQLQRDLTACQNSKANMIDKNESYMNVLVHFPVGKTNVTTDQQPNVQRIANYMKSHPEATCTINGYASPEGSEDINIRLADGRAQSVKDMLVKKYGIAANRINAKGQGISNMFDELSWNRVSICEIIVK